MSHRYFENRSCAFYPCHRAAHINCLFCFCPLYTFSDCGGNFQMIRGRDGTSIKDCSSCLLPHMPDGYDYVLRRLQEA